MSATPHPVVVRTARLAPGELLRAVRARLDARTLSFGLPMLALLVAGASFGLNPVLYMAPAHTVSARMLEVLTLGAVMCLLVMLADEAVDRGAPRVASYAAAVIAGALLGSLIAYEFRELLGMRIIRPGQNNFGSRIFPTLHRFDLIIIAMLVGGLATFVHVNRRTSLAARKRQFEAERARARAQRRTLESELQALQARVEPMFLFDTLERIRGLYRADAAAGGAMLEDLIVYLRAALPHMRESSSALAQELMLARSWLEIVGRSGTRRSTEISADDAAGSARMPALVLLPLVQHAITGQLSEEGDSRLAVRARVEGERLRIEVATSTDAFAGGVAASPLLAQIDERLRALHGDLMRFEGRASAAGAGSEAVVELPLEVAETSEAEART